MQAVTQALQSGTGAVRGADRFLRVSDVGTTVLSGDTASSSTTADATSTGPIPNPPSNFTVASTTYGARLTWEYPTNRLDAISHVEVWSHSSDALTSAARIAVVTKPVAEFKDVWDAPYADHYYWIRCVSYGGKYSVWTPREEMGGTLILGQTSISERIQEILSGLTGDIQEDPLYQQLLTDMTGDLREDYTFRVISLADGKKAIAGVGLTADNGAGQSEVMVLADRFIIVDPADPDGTPAATPFIIGNVDGISSVGVNGRMVVDGSLLAKAISTEHAFIGHTIQSTNYSAGTSGWKIDGTTGLAEFNGITFRITDATAAANVRSDLNVADGATNDAGIYSPGTTEIDGGKIHAGSKVVVGNDNIILDGDPNGAGTPGSGAITCAPDGGPAGQDYCRLDNGDLDFYYWDGGRHQSYKSVKRTESGTGKPNNTTVTIPGYWRQKPEIIVSPCSLSTYNKNYSGYDQKLNCSFTQLALSGGVCTFRPYATLSLSNGVESSSPNKQAYYSGDLPGKSWLYRNSPSWNTFSYTTKIALSGYVWDNYGIRDEQLIRLWVYVDGSSYYVGSWVPKGSWGDVTQWNWSYTVSGLSSGTHSVYIRMGLYQYNTSNNPGTTYIKCTSMSCYRSTITTLATGTLNYIAIGE
jgi:hypothetical protein